MKKVVLLAFVLLLLSTAVVVGFIRHVSADGTIYIRADGSIEGTTHISTVDNVTYTFTDNIYDEIVVERDNIVVDGAGYTLQGTGSGTGIDLTVRSNVTIKNMEIKSFSDGIYIWLFSSYNTISGNNITNNEDVGICLYDSSNNIIYHNNFIDNTNQTYVEEGDTNTWDDGYPSGGNYWSDYTDVDQYSGSYQNETGSDLIWDHPYVIDENNQDNYPIVPEFPTWTSIILVFVILTVAIAISKRRLLKTSIH